MSEVKTPARDVAIEAHLATLGLTAPRVTADLINSHIAKVDYNYNEAVPKMECIITMKNGFKFVGNNLIVSAANFNMELAKELSYNDAYRQIWGMEAYSLKTDLYKQALKAAQPKEQVNDTEYVVCVFLDLLKHGIADSENVQSFTLDSILKDYPEDAILTAPRKYIDNKSDAMLDFGRKCPQLLPYLVVRNLEGKVLTYRRKGKEEGLLGNRSFGVGGHIDMDDLYDELGNKRKLMDLVATATAREVEEELALKVINPIDLDFFDAAIYNPTDKTSTVHLAIVGTIAVDPSTITPNPSEFLDVIWMSPEELVEYHKTNTDAPLENWSATLVENGYLTK